MALMKTISAIEGNNKELIPLIPKATTDTSNMIASSTYSSSFKYRAFDDDISTAWLANVTTISSSSIAYIGYKFDNNVSIKAFSVSIDSALSGYTHVTLWRLEYSTDSGSTWINANTLGEYNRFMYAQPQDNGITGLIILNNEITCNAIRLYATSKTDTSTYVRLGGFQVYS